MRETRRLEILPTNLHVSASVLTDPGCLRDSNEDSGRHISPQDPETLTVRGRLTIVADGMGGHASGDVASRMVVDLISKKYYLDDDREPQESLCWAIETANREIFEMSQTDERLAGMGTTLVALVVIGDTAFSAHVGDSRLYRMRGRRLELLTLDHSHVMEMVQSGVITAEQARSHGDKNVILRAVGTQPEVDIEVSGVYAVEAGDSFLLCTDGLNDMVEDSEIESILAAESDGFVAAENLIAAAKANGGHDNVTVGIVKVDVTFDEHPPQRVRVTREVEAL